MDEVIVPPRYQVVIPETIRKHAGIKSGTKLQVFGHDDRIIFVKVGALCEKRGFPKGCYPTFNHDGNDRT